MVLAAVVWTVDQEDGRWGGGGGESWALPPFPTHPSIKMTVLAADGRWHLAQITGNLCRQLQRPESSGALYRHTLMKTLMKHRMKPRTAHQPAAPLWGEAGEEVYRRICVQAAYAAPHWNPPRSFKHTDTSNGTRGCRRRKTRVWGQNCLGRDKPADSMWSAPPLQGCRRAETLWLLQICRSSSGWMQILDGFIIWYFSDLIDWLQMNW